MTYSEISTQERRTNNMTLLNILRAFIGFYAQTGHENCGCRPRDMEWLTTFLVFSWGLFLTLPINSISGVDFDDEVLWGFVAMTLALTRCGALIINGHWRRSPALRMVLSSLAAAFWAAEGVYILSNGISGHTTFAFYPVLVAAEFMAISRSAKDSVSNMGR